MGLSHLILFSLCLVGFDGCLGYRILGIFPLNARSHMIMFEELMKGLARRGHQVDVVSTFPQKTPYPNYTDIILPPAQPKLVNNMSYAKIHEITYEELFEFIPSDAGNLCCEKGLQDPQLQRIIRHPPRNPPYDLVIVEFLSSHCFMAFGHHLNVPTIGVSSCALHPWNNHKIGNPDNLAFSPNNLLALSENMSFWERFYNVIHTLCYKFLFDHYTSPQTEIVRKYFGENTPGVRELEDNVALVLTNSHPSLNGIKPITPALIEVGGLHVQDDGPELPAADKKWLDESTDGFVYFTFGSMVMIESFPQDIIKVLYKSLGKIAPIRVLMKVPFPEMLPPGLPKNIRTFSWISQVKVLKHKNIRAFITHGGMMGTQEAITYAVPVIGVPLFADQFINVDLLVKKNVALGISHLGITEEKLDHALNEILNNPKYRNAMKKLSDRFLDRPQSAMDTACFWVEYVIRHGSESLRSASRNLSWWQNELFDIYAVLFIFAALTIIIIAFVARFFINFILRKISDETDSKSEKKLD